MSGAHRYAGVFRLVSADERASQRLAGHRRLAPDSNADVALFRTGHVHLWSAQPGFFLSGLFPVDSVAVFVLDWVFFLEAIWRARVQVVVDARAVFAGELVWTAYDLGVCPASAGDFRGAVWNADAGIFLNQTGPFRKGVGDCS